MTKNPIASLAGLNLFGLIASSPVILFPLIFDSGKTIPNAFETLPYIVFGLAYLYCAALDKPRIVFRFARKLGAVGKPAKLILTGLAFGCFGVISVFLASLVGLEEFGYYIVFPIFVLIALILLFLAQTMVLLGNSDVVKSNASNP